MEGKGHARLKVVADGGLIARPLLGTHAELGSLAGWGGVDAEGTVDEGHLVELALPLAAGRASTFHRAVVRRAVYQSVLGASFLLLPHLFGVSSLGFYAVDAPHWAGALLLPLPLGKRLSGASGLAGGALPPALVHPAVLATPKASTHKCQKFTELARGTAFRLCFRFCLRFSPRFSFLLCPVVLLVSTPSSIQVSPRPLLWRATSLHDIPRETKELDCRRGESNSPCEG